MPVRVLIVDDEPSIRTLVTRILQLEGVEVTGCESAAAALDAIQTESFDVIVTDLRMETPTAGFDVLRAASELRPRPKLMLLSAYAVTKEDLGDLTGVRIVQKGTDTLQLPAVLREMIKRAA